MVNARLSGISSTLAPAIGVLALLGHTHAWAAGEAYAAPGAGQLLQQVQPSPGPQPYLPAASGERLKVDEAPAASQTQTEALRFPVANIAITGVTVMPLAELVPLVSGAIGRDVSLAELHELAERITQYYRDKGYLVARAFVPAQEIRQGAVEIAVREGRMGRIDLRNESRLRTDRARALFATLVPGSVITRQSLERSVGLLAETPGVEARATLRPGEAPGTSDLLVETADGPRWTADVVLDNHGPVATGRGRLAAGVVAQNPMGLGDAVSVRALTSGSDLNHGRVAYQVPVWPGGASLGVAWSGLTYSLGGAFAPLGAEGKARVGSILASYPLLRRADASATVVLNYDDKRLEDRLLAVGSFSRRKLTATTLGISGDAADALLGGGVVQYGLAVSAGELRDLEASGGVAASSSPEALGKFTKVSASLARLHHLGGRWSVWMAVQGQTASKALDGAERFVLGGPHGVRAYPANEGVGDTGYVATLEGRYLLGAGLEAALFLDGGEVRSKRESDAVGEGRRNLTGAGLGLDWQPAAGYRLRSHLAWRLEGDAPQTDTDRRPRFWMQVARRF